MPPKFSHILISSLRKHNKYICFLFPPMRHRSGAYPFAQYQLTVSIPHSRQYISTLYIIRRGDGEGGGGRGSEEDDKNHPKRIKKQTPTLWATLFELALNVGPAAPFWLSPGVPKQNIRHWDQNYFAAINWP